MATQAKKAPTKAKAGADDAIASLMADHKRVKALFEEFKGLMEEGSDEDKQQLVTQICSELTIHATIEEEIFYPAVREEIEDEDLMDEAEVEHAGAKDLVEQLQSMEPGEDLYDAKVTVLGEYIDHHVKEEEGDMFPKARKAKLDLVALGQEMEDRRTELKAELGAEGAEADDDEEESEEDEGAEKESAAPTQKGKKTGSRR